MIINIILLLCTVVALGVIYILKIEHDLDKDMYRQRLEELYLEKQYREEAESELELLKRIESLRVESMKKYGVDISGDWDKTATSKTAALEQAYLRGRADERKRYETLASINSVNADEFEDILEDCGIDRIKPSEESDYVKATMIDDRPACCIDHDVYGATCDTCEFGLED